MLSFRCRQQEQVYKSSQAWAAAVCEPAAGGGEACSPPASPAGAPNAAARSRCQQVLLRLTTLSTVTVDMWVSLVHSS